MSDPLADLADLPGVAEAVALARESVDRVLGHRTLRRHRAEVHAESALRGARASAALEGASDDPDDPLVRGAVRVSAELDSLAGAWRTAPRQALARLHALAAADGPAAELGRPRSTPRARDPLGIGPPPPPGEVAIRLDALSRLLTSSTGAPAVVVAAVAHGELLALRPFGWGDGLVARAAARLALAGRGLDSGSLTVPEVGHVELGDAYAEAIRGYASGGAEGVSRWVCHCAEAIGLGAREALAVCEAFARR
jgi:Fic family protein